MEQTIKKVRGIVDKYGWEDKTVSPYGFSVSVGDILKTAEEYKNYTADGRDIIGAEIEGLLRILEKWVEFEEAPRVKVRLLSGNNAGAIKDVNSGLAEDMVAANLAVYV